MLTDCVAKKLNFPNVFYKNDHVLSDVEKNTKLIDSTLESYRKVTNRPDVENIIVKDFFGDIEVVVTSEVLSDYFSNIMQYNMFNFMSSMGYKKVVDLAIKDGEFVTQARKGKVQCDENKYFDSYVEGFIFFENREMGKKLCVKLYKQQYGSVGFYYEIFSEKEDTEILIEWKKYSQNNNFYKGKKISADCSFLNINKNITWDDVIIDEKIKNVIVKNIEKLFSISDLLEKNKIQLKRGIILSGNPGCVVAGTKIKVRKKKEEGIHKIINNTI